MCGKRYSSLSASPLLCGVPVAAVLFSEVTSAFMFLILSLCKGKRTDKSKKKKEKYILLCGGNRLVEIQASSLVYSLTIKSGTEEQK